MGGVLQADFSSDSKRRERVAGGGTLSTAGATLELGLGMGRSDQHRFEPPEGFSAYGSPWPSNRRCVTGNARVGLAAFTPQRAAETEVRRDTIATVSRNGLDLRGGARGVSVNAKFAVSTRVTLAGNLGVSVGGGGMTERRPGALTLAGTNVVTGATYVTGGLVTLAPDRSNSLGEVQLSALRAMSVATHTEADAGNLVSTALPSTSPAGGQQPGRSATSFLTQAWARWRSTPAAFYTRSELTSGSGRVDGL
jgi:hypothetical protein